MSGHFCEIYFTHDMSKHVTDSISDAWSMIMEKTELSIEEIQETGNWDHPWLFIGDYGPTEGCEEGNSYMIRVPDFFPKEEDEVSIHLEHTLTLNDLPWGCIHDCSRPGPVDETVQKWRNDLNFTVDRDNAINHLEQTGAWERDQLEQMSDIDLAEIILWMACGTFNDFIQQADEKGIDPWRDVPEDFSPDEGSDIFVLE